jgi:hypothetical protein
LDLIGQLTGVHEDDDVALTRNGFQLMMMMMMMMIVPRMKMMMIVPDGGSRERRRPFCPYLTSLDK